jgi:hypothetical protein
MKSVYSAVRVESLNKVAFASSLKCSPRLPVFQTYAGPRVDGGHGDKLKQILNILNKICLSYIKL